VLATVEVRLIGSDLGETMRRMRLWLDHRKIAAHTFRQSVCPGGLALHIEFNAQTEAEDFAAQFAGRVLGSPPVYPTAPVSAPPRR
jgi:hypothetical protein